MAAQALTFGPASTTRFAVGSVEANGAPNTVLAKLQKHVDGWGTGFLVVAVLRTEVFGGTFGRCRLTFVVSDPADRLPAREWDKMVKELQGGRNGTGNAGNAASAAA